VRFSLLLRLARSESSGYPVMLLHVRACITTFQTPSLTTKHGGNPMSP